MQTHTSIREDAHHLENIDLIEVYKDLSPRLFRYAYRLLGDSDLAEDCVAETFSRFLQALNKGGGPRENLQAYLYRMAHNWISDFYREQKPEDIFQSELLDGTTDKFIDVVANNQDRERIRLALLQLTEEQRQVIMLRFYEEWTHDEIASLIGKTVEATRALQHRALVGLRKMLISPEE